MGTFTVAKSIIELLLRYFRTMHPLKMLWHLVWIMLVLAMMSITYITTFHFTPVLDMWQRSRSMQNFTNELTTSIQVDARITEELQKVLTNTMADRTYVFRYHNGIPAVGGIPFIFHTNTHELIRPGVNRVISLMQRIPSSINVHMNQEFAKGKCITLAGIDKDTTGHDYWYYQARGARHMIRCPIYSRNHDLIGFVGVDYVQEGATPNLDAHETYLTQSAHNIGQILQQRE
jgi:hypothetical protein